MTRLSQHCMDCFFWANLNPWPTIVGSNTSIVNINLSEIRAQLPFAPIRVIKPLIPHRFYERWEHCSISKTIYSWLNQHHKSNRIFKHVRSSNWKVFFQVAEKPQPPFRGFWPSVSPRAKNGSYSSQLNPTSNISAQSQTHRDTFHK